MDYGSCHVVYVDKRAYKDRYEEPGRSNPTDPSTYVPGPAGDFPLESRDVQCNLRNILHIFNGVHVCTSGISCMAKLRELNESIETDLIPTIVILDVFLDSKVDSRPFEKPSLDRNTPSPMAQPSSPQRQKSSIAPDPEDFYSLSLLQHIVNEVSYSNLSKLIIPIAMTHNSEGVLISQYGDASGSPPRIGPSSYNQLRGTAKPIGRVALDSSAPVEPKRMMKCLEAGAIDVLTSPLHQDRIYALTAHAYRAHKEAAKDQAAFLATKRLRKRSWVGIDEEQPYGYLRESMVSTLMTSICKPESVIATQDQRNLYVLDHRREAHVAKAINQWNFSAHDFSEDELVHASFLMLQHALDMPELEAWRLPTDELKNFLMACRAAYNGFVLYHNFRHVVDVLQAVFYFLLQLGTLPPYPTYSAAADRDSPITPMEALLKPFDALTLLISAIGHDVGHPGVSNAFLVALKAPLAQLYNDNSVLEAFHCAAYSQILRRYWNHAFEDSNMRNLLIKSILATDMGVHFKYMADLGNLQEKLHHNKGTGGWNDKTLDEYRTLICGLLIKCADISNVARPFKVAAKWSDILQLEFARQGEMEKDVGIPTTLFGGPPELGNVTKLAKSQVGFMNIFAGPLFESVADILPGMQFAVKEIKVNQEVWNSKIKEERRKQDLTAEEDQYASEGFHSPRSGSPHRLMSSQPGLSHPEGLPASGSSPSLPTDPPISTSSPLPNLDSRHTSLGSHSAVLTDTRSTSLSQNPSRRSSYGQVHGYSSSGQDTVSHSRRSSGAFPAANILPPTSSATRRSSNTVPSQLQVNMAGPNPTSNPSAGAVSRENTPPGRSASTDIMPNSSFGGSVTGVNDTKSRHGSDSETASAGGGYVSYRSEKGTDGDMHTFHPFHLPNQYFARPLSNRQSTVPSSGRYSTFSSNQDRYSIFSASPDRYSSATSAAFTYASHILPNSPTETQATSFLTDNSDLGNGEGSISSAPDMIHLDRPGSGHRSTADTANENYEEDAGGLEISVGRNNGQTLAGGDRIISRKGSRFRFDFWKRRQKGGSP